MSTLGDRLKTVRKERGVSQADLARAVGARQSSINDIESGRNKTSIYLVKIANVLNVDPVWLENGSGSINGVGVEIVSQGALLPHLNWNGIVDFAIEDGFDTSAAETLYRCPVKHSDRAYTTVLKHEREQLPNGSVLFLDPVGHYSNGDVVMTVLPDSGIADLRRLVSNGSRTFMQSLDTRLDASLRVSECRVRCAAGGQHRLPVTDDLTCPEAVLVGRLFFVGLPFE